ncbi:SDR family oxidoreductase [Aeromonas dhakensis]|nr:SDR family oxidoreductase [Aeromonas dhakensis]
MDYFITGGSGFIGRRLIKKLLQRPNSRAGIQIISATLMDEWREVANC